MTPTTKDHWAWQVLKWLGNYCKTTGTAGLILVALMWWGYNDLWPALLKTLTRLCETQQQQAITLDAMNRILEQGTREHQAHAELLRDIRDRDRPRSVSTRPPMAGPLPNVAPPPVGPTRGGGS